MTVLERVSIQQMDLRTIQQESRFWRVELAMEINSAGAHRNKRKLVYT